MLRQEKGITLVALIITVIILIILAAVSIAALTSGGFIPLTVNASQDYSAAQNNEARFFDYWDNSLQMIEYNIKHIESGAGA